MLSPPLPPNSDSTTVATVRAFRRRAAWLRTWRGGVVLAATAVLLYLPGLFVLPPIDRDEARFAEATRQMAAADHWRAYIVPRVDGEPRLNKPPLIYWLQAAAVEAFDVPASAQVGPTYLGGIWAYRLPSVVGAVVAVLVTWRLGLRMYAGSVGALAALLLGISAVVMFDVRQARVDQVLLACTAGAQWALWMIWRRRAEADGHGGWAALLWISLSLGVLTKGPLTPMVVALTALTLCVLTRDWRWLQRLRPGWGVPLCVALVSPWVIAVSMHVGWDRLAEVIWAETLGRGMSAREGHFGPPGYYLVLLPVLFWPGSLALVPGLWRAVERGLRLRSTRDDACRGRVARWRAWWRARRLGTSAELFCLAWLVPNWIVFELAMTKLPHYVLPLFPALALLCARGLLAGGHWRRLVRKSGGTATVWAWTGLSVVAGVGLPLVLVLLLGQAGVLASGAVVGLAFLAVGLSIVLLQSAARGRFVAVQMAAVGLATTMYLSVFQFVLPNLDPLWLSKRMADRIAAIDPDYERPLAAAGYHEESLIFLRRGRIERLDWWELSEWLSRHPRGLAVVSTGPVSVPNVRTLAVVPGYNYSQGRWQTLELVEPVGE